MKVAYILGSCLYQMLILVLMFISPMVYPKAFVPILLVGAILFIMASASFTQRMDSFVSLSESQRYC